MNNVYVSEEDNTHGNINYRNGLHADDRNTKEDGTIPMTDIGKPSERDENIYL